MPTRRYAIGQSFTRREKAVDILAQMKTAALSLWLLHRDQDQQAVDGQPRPGVGGLLSKNVALVLQDLMCSVRSYLTTEQGDSPGKETPVTQVYLNRILVSHSTLSVLNEKLVFKGNQANGGIGRVDEYRRALMLGFEQLRALRQYQSSPVRMQRFCVIMVHLAPMILAPFWRHYCHDYNKNLGISPQKVCIPAYLSCSIFVSVLCTLLRVAVDIADPWDGVGQDDIAFRVPEEIEWATHAAPMGFDEHGHVVFTWTPDTPDDDEEEHEQLSAAGMVMQRLRRITGVDQKDQQPQQPYVASAFNRVERAPAGGGSVQRAHDEEADALLSVRHRHPAGAEGGVPP